MGEIESVLLLPFAFKNACPCTSLVPMPEEEEEKGLGFQPFAHVPNYY